MTTTTHSGSALKRRPGLLRALIEEARRRATRRRLMWLAAAVGLAAAGAGLYLGLSGARPPSGPSGSTSLTSKAERYTDAARHWSLRYPSRLHVEHSQTPPGVLVRYFEVTVASFPPQRGVRSHVTASSSSTRLIPPFARAGRFPAGGIAFRLSYFEGGPAVFPVLRETHFPLTLDRFTAMPRGDVIAGPPPELKDYVYADGNAYTAEAWIGPRASSKFKNELQRVVSSLRFPHLRPGVARALGRSGRYPERSITLVRTGGSGYYLVHAPRGFYAVERKWQTYYHHHVVRCLIALDRLRSQFFCPRRAIRWNRYGSLVIRPPRMAAPLNPVRVTVGWDGHLIVTGMGLGARDVRALWAGASR